MKKSILLILSFICSLSYAQDTHRETIEGQIIVEENELIGISIYNTISKKGAVTNKNGEFTIDVALNDVLQIRALEYQDFDVTINAAVLASKKITIYLFEEINRLDEVVITNKKLTGNIETDVDNISFSPKQDAVYFGIRNNTANDVNYVNQSQFKNVTTHSQSQAMVNGLNVINVVDQLLIPLFRSEVKDKKAVGIPEVPAKSIKYYLGSKFIVDNFEIPEHRVEEFIRYVENEEFNFDLLNYGNELALLELLHEKSKIFLDTKKVKE